MFFSVETGADLPGCMAMQPGKIYQARFRWFFGWFVASFIPLLPEAPPVAIWRCR
ncbi:hypothetical protein MT560_004671 [Salmonella enterica]|nr:hypothetical protein [Salmonella enterica subsp. enterica serovar Nima]EEO5360700.1 hypothetical protein [Salmonella enterica]EDU4601721.1 hypothetical protein [Salmonella enterica subsp. enterica serovar Nima]EHF4363291.1 hypothetical protein [Salmonella enterica]EID0173800.1 hypothetical protein [Salmonella enterica]